MGWVVSLPIRLHKGSLSNISSHCSLQTPRHHWGGTVLFFWKGQYNGDRAQHEGEKNSSLNDFSWAAAPRVLCERMLNELRKLQSKWKGGPKPNADELVHEPHIMSDATQVQLHEESNPSHCFKLHVCGKLHQAHQLQEFASRRVVAMINIVLILI